MEEKEISHVQILYTYVIENMVRAGKEPFMMLQEQIKKDLTWFKKAMLDMLSKEWGAVGARGHHRICILGISLDTGHRTG